MSGAGHSSDGGVGGDGSGGSERRDVAIHDDQEETKKDEDVFWLPDRNEEDTGWVRTSDEAKACKSSPQDADSLAIVKRRKELFIKLVKTHADKYLRDHVTPGTWKKNIVSFPDGKVYKPYQKWLLAPDPLAHEDQVRYKQYGCTLKLVDSNNESHQTFGGAPKTYPTIWVCCCTKKCMACYDITQDNTTPMNKHLTDGHNIQKRQGHGSKAAAIEAKSMEETRRQKPAGGFKKEGTTLSTEGSCTEAKIADLKRKRDQQATELAKLDLELEQLEQVARLNPGNSVSSQACAAVTATGRTAHKIADIVMHFVEGMPSKKSRDSVAADVTEAPPPPPTQSVTCSTRPSLATTRSHQTSVHVLRLLPGDDLLLSIRDFVQSRGLRAAFIMTCVGSIGKCCLRPAAVAAPMTWQDRAFEIVSLTGTMESNGQGQVASEHLHMSVSDHECNVFGGHVVEGCIVRTTAELVVGVCNHHNGSLVLSRKVDARTGYKELFLHEPATH